MNRALIWKEFREQGLIVAALVILGGAVLVAAGLLFPGSGSDSLADMRKSMEPKKLAVVMLILASGIVVGGTLFAGEREQGTFPYLEHLPVPRWRVWLGKVLAGLVLVVIAAGLLFGVAAAVGVIGPRARLPFWGLILITLALAAYSWGALGSAFAKTSLAACGLGLLSAVGLLFVLYPVSAIGVQLFDRVGAALWGANPTVNHVEYALYATLLGLVIVPLAISAWIYTAPDRNRFARDVRTARGGPVDPVRKRMLPKFTLFPALGVRASLWVVARQNLALTLVLGGITLVAGLSLLQPTLPALFVWPVSTLMLGTIVGVTGWSDEQNAGSFRFWAERRMPVGRLWLAKVVFGAALVALLVVLLAVPSLVAASFAESGPFIPNVFRARLFLDRDFPIAEYLWLWPVYGFAFGHLAGMLFRKAAVGTAVGLMTGGAVVALWLPSLLSGGIHWYQLWIPPLLALLTARALVWSWALDQLGQRRALLRLAGGSGAIVLAMTAGIAYRVLEIPTGESGGADIAFRATIPPFDTNEAGREIRRGAVLFSEVRLKERELPQSERPLWYEGPSQREAPTAGQKTATTMIQLEDVLHLGWPADRPEADAWLVAAMANGWAESLVRAARMPIGTVEDPVELIIGSPLKHLDNLQGCEVLLLARGLQLQAAHPEALVESVAACLSLTRNLRNKSFAVCGLVSVRVEQRTHLAIRRWLEKLGDRPDLLREILALVRAHDAACPPLFADGHLAEQTTMRNSVNAPTQSVKEFLREQPFLKRETSESAEALENETELVAFGWAVPWEKERLSRIVGLGNTRPYTRDERRYLRGAPGLGEYAYHTARLPQANPLSREIIREELVVRRASMLLLALRLHRAENGALPANLEALVPRYLPAVPLDPYDERPFRYRRTKGEVVQMEALPAQVTAMLETFGGVLGGMGHETRGQSAQYETRIDPGFDFAAQGPVVRPAFRMLDLAAGRGILWSIGPDKLDGDGKRLVPRPLAVQSPGAVAEPGDLIYVVPEPLESKR